MPRYRKDYVLYPRRMKNGTSVWYYRTYDEYGQRTTGRSTGQINKTLAERYCNDLLKRGELIPVKETLFRNYAADWWLWDRCLYIRGRLARSKAGKPAISKNYAKEMRSVLQQYILPYFENHKLANISPHLIEKWMFGLLDKGLSPKRVNNILSCMRVMLGEAHRVGLIKGNPFRAVRPLADNSRERGVFTIDEVRKLFNRENIGPVWGGHLLYRVINELAAVSGMRQGEILAIRDGDLHDGYINVAHSWNPQFGLGPTKTRQIRDVPVPIRVIDDMQLFIGTGGFVFSFNNGRTPATGSRVTNWLYRALKNIDISEEERRQRNLTFHSWRHFFNSVMRARQIPAPILQRVTGHTTTQMLERYTHFDLADFVEIAKIQEQMFEH
ncbi:MAG: tyrosine-type recombinase/integrase [Spirochaetes bacterium]|nr:tyrosine-type recombinase/integrase [Spirochaetota bacterium]